TRLPSEAVLRRHAEQVGVALVGTADGAATGREVDLGILRLQVGEGEAHVHRIADVPGGTDRVPAAIVVGQARGAVLDAGRGFVIRDATAQGPGVVELVFRAQRHERGVLPAEGLDRVRVGVVELDAHFAQRRPAGFGPV